MVGQPDAGAPAVPPPVPDDAFTESTGSPHHGATGGLTPFERLERGGDLGETDLPADHRADRPGPGEMENAVPDVDALPGREEVHTEGAGRPGRVDEGEADADEVEVPVNARLDRQAVAPPPRYRRQTR